LEYENHSYVIALNMKKKILNDEIRKEDLDTDEKILNYFRGYFSLYPVPAINAKLTFTQKFGIVLSNNLSKRIGDIASYITLKEKDKRSIKEKILDLVDNNNNKISKEFREVKEEILKNHLLLFAIII